MISRKILGKEWKTLDDAFYSKPPISPLRGSYWCWLMQGKGDRPKIWFHVSFFGVKNKINGVDVDDRYLEDGSLKTLITSWYIKNNKVVDYFLEDSRTVVGKNSMICKSKSGYVLKLDGHLPNYNLTLEKNGKKIFFCASSGKEFDGKPVIYKKDYNTKSYLTDDKKSYWMVSETIRLPVIAKSTNVFTDAKCNFMGEKFSGMIYAEKYHGFGPAVPWKYAIFDLKDGSRIRFFWVFKNIRESKHDLSFAFDCVPTGKKYFLENFGNVKFSFLDEKMKNSSEKLLPSSKYILVRGKNQEGDSMEMLAEIVNRHAYRYQKWFLCSNYNQFILRLKKVNFFEKGKRVVVNPKGAYGYGEYTDIVLKGRK